jgi:hypothetical protein
MNEGLTGTAIVTGLVADVVRALSGALVDAGRTLAIALAHSSTALAMCVVLLVALILVGLVIRIAWLFAVLIAVLVIMSQLISPTVGTAEQASQVAVCHPAAIACGRSNQVDPEWLPTCQGASAPRLPPL